MFKLFILLVALIPFSSIYTYTIKDLDANEIHLGDFKGKKILLVNTACNSTYSNQFRGLEELYQKYKDSLVIIAFPSNSFGNETGDDAAIKEFISAHYHTHFIIAQKTAITGIGQEPIYQWLTQLGKNGVMDNTIKKDFHKFLIDGAGNLVGSFAPSVDPMSDVIQTAIQTQN